MTKPAGFLALILHAHLPFVRHPEHPRFLEEEWLFEALTESYIPLLRMLQRVLNDGIPVKIAMSVTPTLCAMLQDELLCRRYLEHLDRLISLAESECQRNRNDAVFAHIDRFGFRDRIELQYKTNQSDQEKILSILDNSVFAAALTT